MSRRSVPITMTLMRQVRTIITSGALAGVIVACGPSDSSPSDDVTPPDAEAIASAFMVFAVARDEVSFADLPLAPDITLALGGDVRRSKAAAELLDPNAWRIHAGAEGFRERVGPFSALDVVADAGAVTAIAGRHGGCAAPDEPLPPPRELVDLHVVSIQPDRGEVTTCMQWWAVDIFVTEGGLIVGVDLDLGAP